MLNFTFACHFESGEIYNELSFRKSLDRFTVLSLLIVNNVGICTNYIWHIENLRCVHVTIRQKTIFEQLCRRTEANWQVFFVACQLLVIEQKYAFGLNVL